MPDPYTQFMTPDYVAGQMAEKLVNDYNRNPHAFSEEEGQSIAYIAARYDLSFKPESKGLQKFFYSLVNTGTFGALGGLGVEAPMETGEEYGFGSTAGKAGEMLGGAAGFASPGYVGAKLAGAGLRGAAKLAPGMAAKATASPRLSSAIRGGAYGGAAFGLSDMLGDPSGVPENVAYGAVGGAALGAFFPNLFSRPETLSKYGNEVPLLQQSNIGPRGQLGSATGGGSSMPMTSGQPQLGAGQRLPLQMGRVPRQNRLPEVPSVGKPINLGGDIPYMTDDMDKVVNAIRNMQKQEQWGGKAAFNRFKSQIDSERWFNGTLTNEVSDLGRPAY